ncbi:hypothetical protein [Paenibacillus xylaniclasticus]|uniref:hypothetical protein n=1 Tax=Paenibacillus xylaniclasticus TaxID=588083 RepID=UPI000FD70C26|nr:MULTISPECIES: hypothetical protein [Paenibacillus]GFN32542.1 hypothetical protein PCURB6_28020 [Paenibacillus curdlanolyticus]
MAMRVYIRETGEYDFLSLTDPKTGQHFENELIGNFGGLDQFVYDEELDAYIVSKENYEWWWTTLNLHQQLEDKLFELKKEYDSEVIEDVIRHINGVDLQDDARLMLEALNEEFSK